MIEKEQQKQNEMNSKMRIFIKIILLICWFNANLIAFARKRFSNDTCHNLPRQCKYIPYRKERILNGVVCKNEFHDAAFMREFTNAWYGCSSMSKSIKFSLSIKYSPKRPIFDQSFESVFKIGALSKRTYQNFLTFLKVHGFDIDTHINVDYIYTLKFYSDFNIYKSNRLLTGCHDFNRTNFSNNRTFIFGKHKDSFKYFRIIIKQPKAAYPICSLFFQNAYVELLQIDNMVDSYLMKKLVTFTSPSFPTIDLNSTILMFVIDKSHSLDLNASILNPMIFAQTRQFEFVCKINSIETSLFKHFTRMHEVAFNSANLIDLIRRRGIEWIRSINAHVNVNVSHELDFYDENRLVKVTYDFQRDFYFITSKHFAYDHDFCLFIRFPFNQMVTFRGRNLATTLETDVFTCTELWLFQYYKFLDAYFDISEYSRLNRSNFTACEFERRIELCNKTRFPIANTETSPPPFGWFDFWLLGELLLIMVTPLWAAYAIVSNLIVIRVIYHEKNVKTLREKHYIYMSLSCFFNSLISSIQIIDLMSECQYPFGFYCSSARYIVSIQYVHIVFGEYVNSVARLLSNFAYLGFAVCRMFKVGKDHGKCIQFVNDTRIKTYMGVCVLVSAGVSVCKSLQFDINWDLPDYSSPIPFVQNSERDWIFHAGYVAITVINSLYDALNYLVFVLVHLVIDLVLVNKMRRVLREREERAREMATNNNVSSKAVEKVCKENQESMRRVVRMVMFCSLFNLATKVPSMIASLNDVRLVIQWPVARFDDLSIDEWFRFNPVGERLSFMYFCSSEKMCVLFRRLGNCLFMISLGSTLHFLKSFDLNFATAFDQTFFKENKLAN